MHCGDEETIIPKKLHNMYPQELCVFDIINENYSLTIPKTVALTFPTKGIIFVCFDADPPSHCLGCLGLRRVVVYQELINSDEMMKQVQTILLKSHIVFETRHRIFFIFKCCCNIVCTCLLERPTALETSHAFSLLSPDHAFK